MAVERKTRLRGAQVLAKSIEASDLSGVGEVTGHVATVQSDGTIAYVDTSNLAAVNTNAINIVLNAFRIAINGSLTQFNMVDGIVDEYEDESGIDNPNSINESFDSVNDLYSPIKDFLDTSPFAHYKMNQISGTSVTDDGTGANNGTANVDISNYTVAGQGGALNTAFEFNGSSENIDLDALSIDINSDTSGSFAFWMNRATDASGTIINFSFNNTTFSAMLNIRFQTEGDRINGDYQDNSGVKLWTFTTPINSISINTWHHVVFVHNGSTITVYIDAVSQTLDFTVQNSESSWFNASTFDNGQIGAQENRGFSKEDFFAGKLDDFRYYKNKALTQSEVDVIYNSGTGTEDDQPEGDPNNMTLISNTFTAEAQADNARIVIFEQDVDAITLNTDLKAFASRDAGQTFTTDFATDDKLDITSHGFSNTDRIMVTSSSQDLPAGLSAGIVYYVVNAGTNDFELSLTSGGAAVDITDNGTGTHTAKQVSEITLVNEGEYEAGRNILSASVIISGQPAGTSMEYYLVTANNKDLKIFGTGLSWD